MNRFVRVALMVLVLAASQPFAMQARAESVPEELSSMVTELHDIYVHFKVRVFGLARITGRFERLQGEVITTRDGVATDVRMHIEVASITTDDGWRDAYLRGDSFFEAGRYPRIVFSGSCEDATGQHARIVGNMSLHGVTRPVVFRVEPVASEDGGGAESYLATAVIRRSDFGLHSLQHVVGDEVEIVVAMGSGAGG